jgi:hypothetical protein
MNVIISAFAGVVTVILAHILTDGQHAAVGTIVLENCVFIVTIAVLFKMLGPGRWKALDTDRWLRYLGLSAVYLVIFLAFGWLMPSISQKLPVLATRTILIVLQDWLAATLIGYTCQFLVIRGKQWKNAKG